MAEVGELSAQRSNPMFNLIRRIIMAISAAKQAFLDALAGVKQKIDTGDDTFRKPKWQPSQIW